MCWYLLRQIQCLHPSSFSNILGHYSLFSVLHKSLNSFVIFLSYGQSFCFRSPSLSIPRKMGKPVSLVGSCLVQTVRGEGSSYKCSFLKCSREEQHSCSSLAFWQDWVVVWITIGPWIFCSEAFSCLSWHPVSSILSESFGSAYWVERQKLGKYHCVLSNHHPLCKQVLKGSTELVHRTLSAESKDLGI